MNFCKDCHHYTREYGVGEVHYVNHLCTRLCKRVEITDLVTGIKRIEYRGVIPRCHHERSNSSGCSSEGKYFVPRVE